MEPVEGGAQRHVLFVNELKRRVRAERGRVTRPKPTSN
jgi:hypothetical protein